MAPVRSMTYYERLGVAPDCTFEDLRRAYRRLARELHPDVAGDKHQPEAMAEINEAWRILSDGDLRREYDRTVTVARVVAPVSNPSGHEPNRRQVGLRRQAWVAGVQAQMARLARLAGRSATQTLLIRSPRADRAAYELVVDDLVTALTRDAESRVRAARAAGSAPLDLGVAATLVGIRTVADSMRRAAPLGVSTEDMMAAELLDRMWDVLAHELPVQLTSSLGGNPRLADAIAQFH